MPQIQTTGLILTRKMGCICNLSGSVANTFLKTNVDRIKHLKINYNCKQLTNLLEQLKCKKYNLEFTELLFFKHQIMLFPLSFHVSKYLRPLQDMFMTICALEIQSSTDTFTLWREFRKIDTKLFASCISLLPVFFTLWYRFWPLVQLFDQSATAK